VAVTDDSEMFFSLCLLPALARKVKYRMSNVEYQTDLTDVDTTVGRATTLMKSTQANYG